MHREFFGIISQNPENVKTHCNDRNKLFHFACGNWVSFNQTN